MLDLTEDPPVLLRPSEALKAVVGEVTGAIRSGATWPSGPLALATVTTRYVSYCHKCLIPCRPD